jgi:hypothetical protein
VAVHFVANNEIVVKTKMAENGAHGSAWDLDHNTGLVTSIPRVFVTLPAMSEGEFQEIKPAVSSFFFTHSAQNETLF